MRVLLIGENSFQELVKTQLVNKNIITEQNAIGVSTIENAKAVILNKLVSDKRHLDMIIISNHVTDDAFSPFADWVRYSTLSYSQDNFKLNALPIILFGKGVREIDYYKYGYNALINQTDNGNNERLFEAIKRVIKQFRDNVFDDLDRLNIDVKKLQRGFLYSDKAGYDLRVAKNAISIAGVTKVLSATFIRCPIRLEFEWMNSDNIIMEVHITRYDDILRNLKKYNKVDSEKRILHALYNDAPWILQQDLYDKPLYEPSLMKASNSNEYEEPDFILPSAFPGYIDTNLVEVKPHLVKIVHDRQRKPYFVQKFHEGLYQTAYYQRFLNKEHGKAELEKHLTYLPTNITYTLLASNDQERARNPALVEELINHHFSKIKLETHDDRLKQAFEYFERTGYFK